MPAHARPAAFSARSFGASLALAGMPLSNQADTKNEQASSMIANGAVSQWISMPASPGPIRLDAESDSAIPALASTRFSSPMRSAMNT